MKVSRWRMTIKNIAYGYLSNFIILLIDFISRTIFIKTLGATYLGVNGLFTNVLGVLSFAELGIGTALNFSLYKPVAEDNKEKIKAIMVFYKNAYRVIALIISIAGLILLPFLKYLIKDPGDIGNVYVYYLIFLFNTVTSYFVSYKFSLVNAEQKNYIMTRINMIVNIITKICQILIILLTKNFLAYLLTAAAIGLLQKIFIAKYLNNMYPYLLEKNVDKIEKEELDEIKKNVGGLIWHKVGEMSINQTDNILISSFVNITTVGLVSNYTIIIQAVQSFLTLIFSGMVSSLGNLVATTDIKKQFSVFKVYNFVNFWLFGFSAIAFFVLIPPFITLWIGAGNLIDTWSLLLICINFYFTGQHISFINYKAAFGVFYDDKYVALQAAILNLIFSIIGVKLIGLPGIYVGTVLSGLYQNIRKPAIAYKRITGDEVSNYFMYTLEYFIIVLIPAIVMYFISLYVFKKVTVINFIVIAIILTIVVNGWFILICFKKEEFKCIKNKIFLFFKERKNGKK